MMNGEQYKDSVRKLKRTVYAMGEKIDNVVDHPLTRPHVSAAALTYELAHDPQYRDLMTTTSHLSGKRISRFTHIHQHADDLVKKVKMLRLLGQKTGTCFQRCVGWDALNALYIVTHEVDKKHNTQYFQRVTRFIAHVQENDLMSDGAVTDAKGDRSLAPSQQPDPDMYMHIVEHRKDGIVVRGAKIHQTGAINSHEIIVIPTSAMKPEDREDAVSFAVPADTRGLTFIFGRQASDERRLGGELDQGNAKYAFVGGESMIIFDNVFVPWERVFLCGETEFALPVVETFASFHRQNYGGCKAGVADVLIGASALLAQGQGTAQAAHVRDKLVEMVHLAETLHACSIGCSAEGQMTPAGSCYVNSLLANVAKLNTTRYMYEICRLAHDISGGLLATAPFQQDLEHPVVGPLIQKYYKGNADTPAETRLRLARLIEGMTGCTALIESMHGAGSPQAIRIALTRQANLPAKMELAKDLAGIKPSKL